MRRTTDAPCNDRVQYVALGVLSILVAGATAILSRSQDTSFHRYLGSIHPLLAIGLVTALGFACLGFLRSGGWFEIYSTQKCLKGLAVSAIFATLFAVVVILLDLSTGLRRDLNVPAPQSLLFYPAIAYVAEVSFHALPLALLLLILGPLLRKQHPDGLIWLCIVLASLLEPIFQLSVPVSAKPWVQGYVGLHVFAFNLLQMYIFRRYDFVSMYAFRLVYYIQWHIVWGYARLQLLF